MSASLWTLWVKHADGVSRFSSVKRVNPLHTVDDLTARCTAELLLGVHHSRVTLLLIPSAVGLPTPEAEAAAVELRDPSCSLIDAGVTGGCWLLASVAAAPPGE